MRRGRDDSMLRHRFGTEVAMDQALVLEAVRRLGYEPLPARDPEPGEVLDLRPEIRARYPRMPEPYERFIARVRSCANADETTWFLCAADYNADPADEAFAWKQFFNAADSRTPSDRVDPGEHARERPVVHFGAARFG